MVGLGPIVGCSVLFIGPRNTCGLCLLRRLRGLKHTVGYCNNYIDKTLIVQRTWH